MSCFGNVSVEILIRLLVICGIGWLYMVGWILLLVVNVVGMLMMNSVFLIMLVSDLFNFVSSICVFL